MNVLVAMSGGVDSSVAAALLAEAGHRVMGATMLLLHKETEFGCCGSTRDIEDARAVCARMGVPHYVLDFSGSFEKNIVNPFVDSYLAGETPNPCIACNRHVKFDALLKKAMALGADAVATGHYARVVKKEVTTQIPHPALSQEEREKQDFLPLLGEGGPEGRMRAEELQKETEKPLFRLKRALYPEKDQSYALYHLGQAELARVLFPVGNLTKPEVRATAHRLGLKIADKKESMDICFIPNGDTPGFVKSRAEQTGRFSPTLSPGPIKDLKGTVLGTHRGVAYYTRGQRSGLGVSLGRPVYVVSLNAETNTLYLGDDTDTECQETTVTDTVWSDGSVPTKPQDFLVQIRSRHTPAKARVLPTPDGARVVFETPQRAVTPGQAAVFYEGDEVRGGGRVAEVILVTREDV